MDLNVFDDDPVFKKILEDFIKRHGIDKMKEQFDMFDAIMSEASTTQATNMMVHLSDPFTLGKAIAEHLILSQKEMPAADEKSLAAAVFVAVNTLMEMPVSVRESIESMAKKRKPMMSIWRLPEDIFSLLGAALEPFDEEDFALCRAVMLSTIYHMGFRYSHFEEFGREMKFVEAVLSLSTEESSARVLETDQDLALKWYASLPEELRGEDDSEIRYLAILSGKLPAESGLLPLMDEVAATDFGVETLMESDPAVLHTTSDRVVLKTWFPQRDVAYYAHLFGWFFEPGVDGQLGQVWVARVEGVEFVMVPEVPSPDAVQDDEVKFEFEGPFTFALFFEVGQLGIGEPNIGGYDERGCIISLRDMSNNLYHIVTPVPPALPNE